MLKKENHETVETTMDEKNLALLHENTRYKKRGKDLPNNNMFHKDRNNLQNTKKDR